MIVFPLISLGVLAGATIFGRVTRTPLAAIILALTSGIWLVANKQLEGPILMSFSPTRGLTVSDLLSLVGYAYSLRIAWARYAGATRRKSRAWMLMALCTLVFLVWPLAKLIIWPGVSDQPEFSWISRILG